jgi:hypothetical protein
VTEASLGSLAVPSGRILAASSRQVIGGPVVSTAAGSLAVDATNADTGPDSQQAEAYEHPAGPARKASCDDG